MQKLLIKVVLKAQQISCLIEKIVTVQRIYSSPMILVNLYKYQTEPAKSNSKMCTPLNTKPKICRRFTFYNQNNDSRSFIINISVFENQGLLDLRAILQYLQEKGLNVDSYLFQLPQFNNTFVDVTQPSTLSCADIDDRELIFTMIRKTTLRSMEVQEKRPKEVQRVIGDVIQKVKYWRWLHLNKAMSLKQAAVIVDIPKKSLDDYFLQLRQGQLCDYNFAENLHSKMGELRFYNKKHQKKTGKLPVQIKNIKCFSLVPDIQHLDAQKTNPNDFENEIPGSSMDLESQSQQAQNFFTSKQTNCNSHSQLTQSNFQLFS